MEAWDDPNPKPKPKVEPDDWDEVEQLIARLTGEESPPPSGERGVGRAGQG